MRGSLNAMGCHVLRSSQITSGCLLIPGPTTIPQAAKREIKASLIDRLTMTPKQLRQKAKSG